MLKVLFTKKINEQVKINFKNAYTEWLQATDKEREASYMAEMKKITEKAGCDFKKLIPEKVRSVTDEQKRKQKDFKKLFEKGTGTTINQQMKKDSSFIALAQA